MIFPISSLRFCEVKSRMLKIYGEYDFYRVEIAVAYAYISEERPWQHQSMGQLILNMLLKDLLMNLFLSIENHRNTTLMSKH